MKKITFIIIILGLGYYFTQSFLRSDHTQEDEHDHDEHTSAPVKKTKDKSTQSSSPTTKTKDSEQTKSANHDGHDHGNNDEGFEVEVVDIPRDQAGESLVELGEIASSFANKEVDVDALKDTLTKSGLEVVSTKDSNPYTGSMTVIRTNNSLPGTRYFHAQVFTDESGKPFVQHMSYEYRPSKNAFAEAVAAAKKTFGLTKVADVRKDGFYSWNTEDGYIIWIKRMTAEDLKDDPFNAYTESDIGTIRTAKELEIH
ncbi:hypothetical protein [Halobacteriovorax sp. JY17]|uniref:hypothetical protein n=1 Tax=Halobacteriovorax sp. JY17 TaxID=2014617 RepID=UPI000C390A7E|nr:hypothetical protein [Halobacteriovorax sp. JY17]PIK14743.1 MAG: hypothetical protein CES88_10415 [Halobacteriovorax sp. JY17]